MCGNFGGPLLVPEEIVKKASDRRSSSGGSTALKMTGRLAGLAIFGLKLHEKPITLSCRAG